MLTDSRTLGPDVNGEQIKIPKTAKVTGGRHGDIKGSTYLNPAGIPATRNVIGDGFRPIDVTG